jgi:polar amino acid transport system substrate-binding protein
MKGFHFIKARMTGFVFTTITMLALLVPLPAAGQQVLNRIIDNGVLRVGMSGTQPPFVAKDRSGELIGYEVQLAEALASAMGVELQIVETPFGDLIPALESGEVDAVMSGLTITPERNRRVAFVGPYLVSGKSILTKSSTLAAASETEHIDQANIRVVALANSTSQAFVEALLPRAQATFTADYDSAIQMVLNGEADALVADYPICVLSMLRYPNEGLATLNTPLTVEPIGMAVPAGDALLLNMIENYLQGLQLSGALAELEAFWFENGSWVAALP